MTYNEAVEFLYNQTPQFQRIGAAAYKPGLGTVRRLSAMFGDSHRRYPTIHVAGTNGKGSTAHTLAAVLQSAGYRTGLYTSPHLVDFRERMRVNGRMISHEAVTDFVERYEKLRREADDMPEPSFFELTTVMAFEWFASQNVDVAVIETGLGGRLDSTNIIIPCLSVITNISFDHMAQLGNTLEQIASEKAGIIKPGVAVVCGENDASLKQVFAAKAAETGSEIVFAHDEQSNLVYTHTDEFLQIEGSSFGPLQFQLTGLCQQANSRTVLSALSALRRAGWSIPDEAVASGFSEVCYLTGLMGRWMKLGDSPLVVCDTGHNEGGWELLSRQLAALPRPLVMVIGFVNDKDVSHILPLMPRDAGYLFTRASVPRAMDASELASVAAAYGLEGQCFGSVSSALAKGLEMLAEKGNAGSLFVGGSTFVVADLLADCYSTKIS